MVALLELVARRSEKGFSSLVGEAIESYIESARERRKRQRKVLSLRGSLSPSEAGALKRHAAAVRKLIRRRKLRGG